MKQKYKILSSKKIRMFFDIFPVVLRTEKKMKRNNTLSSSYVPDVSYKLLIIIKN